MKQISLFEAFNKKGSNIDKSTKKSQTITQKQKSQKINEAINKQSQNINIVQSQSIQQQTIQKINKKRNKMILDSDQQIKSPNQKGLNFNEYEIKEQPKQNKNFRIKKTAEKDQEDYQMEIQQNEEEQPIKTKKKTFTQIKNKNVQKNQSQDPLSQFTDATPIWAQKEHCKDAQKRSPDHILYDPTTLYIPEAEWSKFTAPMKQFWKIKSQNFDKIILFKLGKFYQLFYDDAAIGNKYLDLKFMGTKMHTGFPQRSLERYADELVRLGFKTVIVEQMETPDQMNDRIKNEKQKGLKSDKTIKRQVTQILTKGTMPPKDQNQQLFLPNYLMSLRVHQDQYAFSLLQIGTNQILMGIVKGLQNFKTILYQTRPVQVVYDPDNLQGQICRMMQKSFLQIQMSKVVNKKNIWHPLNAINQIQKLEKQCNYKKPKIFFVINQMQDIKKNLLMSSLSGMFQYLKKVFRFDYVVGAARFGFYQKDQQQKPMILDSQALQHLQIFETAEGQLGSLFKTIDRTKTKFGKRLLRRWLMSPLTNINHLNQRLNAVQDLQQHIIQKQKFCDILKKLPDLEKKANKLYHYAVKNTNASKAVYFQDIHVNRLKQFRQFMQKLQIAWQAIMHLQKVSNSFKSNRLKKITKIDANSVLSKNMGNYYDDQEQKQNSFGILPNVLQNLQQFKGYVKWEGNLPSPQKGLVSFFDKLQDQIQNIKNNLEKYLDELRYELNEPNLKFAHTKERYEIQIPQKSEKKRPKDFEFSSKKTGFSRYLSPTTKKLVKQLQKIQESLKQQLGLFVTFFFQQFKKKHQVWHKFIQIIAQIDCLISLSQYSSQGSKVRPIFVEEPKFQIKDAQHPCLTNIDFIPNDILMDKRVMLLTGPNMGGKSTILRTACNLAVLAQLGCYVPATSYKCSPVDRIFTRIGASDKLQLGKSTFFIQMQQTKNILIHGTSRSLAIIDQLGRGTSTFDGLAIAYSVLKDITQRIKCFCLFATHYHILLQQFKNSPNIALMKMGCMIKSELNSSEQSQNRKTKYKNSNPYSQQNQIVFLYKLLPGNVDKSFGLNVARKVGLSMETIKIAAERANLMNSYIEHKQKLILHNVLKFVQDKNQMEQEK